MELPLNVELGDTPGALGLGQAVATRIYCVFYIFYCVAPPAFAIVSDSRLGHYKALVISVIFYKCGCGVLTINSLVNSIKQGWALPGLIIAMVAIAFGSGGFHAIMIAFIADQHMEKRPRVLTFKSGEQVITD